jgi:hypothetical protein
MHYLLMNCEIIWGQDWLERFGYQFQITFGTSLQTYLETLVRILTTDQVNRLFKAQELQENIFCTSSLVESKGFFISLFNNKFKFY